MADIDDDILAATKQVQDMGLDPFDWDAPRGLDGASQIGLGLTRPAARVLRTASLIGAGSLPGQVTKAIAGEDVFDESIRFTDEVIDANTPDVETMGAASRTLATASEFAGTLPFLFGAMPAFLADASVSPGVEALKEGASLQTAAGVGAVQLGVNAVGLRIPNAFGRSLATRMTTGAASNLILGAGADAASAGILEAGGADQLAQSFDWTNLGARGLDAALGAAFGVHAHLDAKATRSQRNAVLTANNADHLNRRTLPGVPVTLDADVQHTRAMQEVLRQLDAGEPVSANINPADFMLRPELRPTSFDAEVEAVLRAEGGFVDDPVDRGGATNFGISSAAHPDVNVANLTREQAKAIYRRDYWDAIDADSLPPELQGMAFDAAVNQGAGWTRQALAEAGGDPAKFLQLREARYRDIVANDPSQQRFLGGWMNRLDRFRGGPEDGASLRDVSMEAPRVDTLADDVAAVVRDAEQQGGVRFLLGQDPGKVTNDFLTRADGGERINAFGVELRRQGEGYQVHDTRDVSRLPDDALFVGRDGETMDRPTAERFMQSVVTQANQRAEALRQTAPNLLEAERVADEAPDIQLIDRYDADNAPVYRPMREALDEIETERVKAANDAEGYVAAVSCFLRRGGDAL